MPKKVCSAFDGILFPNWLCTVTRIFLLCYVIDLVAKVPIGLGNFRRADSFNVDKSPLSLPPSGYVVKRQKVSAIFNEFVLHLNEVIEKLKGSPSYI